MPYVDAALDHLEAGYLNDQAIQLIDRVLDARGLVKGEERLRVLLRKGDRLHLLGRRAAQEETLATARRVAETLQDQPSRAQVERATADLMVRTGRLQEAVEHYERSIALARASGDREREASATGNLGTVFLALDRYDEAGEHFERCFTIAREMGYRKGEAGATGNLGNLLYRLGRTEEAREHYERRLAIALELGDRQGEASATGRLGNVLFAQGCYEEAHEHFERYMTIAREIGDRSSEAIVSGNLGALLFAQGRYKEAWEHLEHARAIAREVGDREHEAIALVNLGPLWLKLGQLDRCRWALDASLSLCREIGARYPEGYAIWGLSDLADEEDDGMRAFDAAREALGLRQEIGHEDGRGSVADPDWVGSRVGPESSTEARHGLGEAMDPPSPPKQQARARRGTRPARQPTWRRCPRSREGLGRGRRSRQHTRHPLLPLEGHRQARAPRRSQAPAGRPCRARPRGVPRVDVGERARQPRDHAGLERAGDFVDGRGRL